MGCFGDNKSKLRSTKVLSQTYFRFELLYRLKDLDEPYKSVALVFQ